MTLFRSCPRGRLLQEQRSRQEPLSSSAPQHKHVATCETSAESCSLPNLFTLRSTHLPYFGGSTLLGHACFSVGAMGPLLQKTYANLANITSPDLCILTGLAPSGGGPCGSPQHTLLKRPLPSNPSPCINRFHFGSRPMCTLLKLCAPP